MKTGLNFPSLSSKTVGIIFFVTAAALVAVVGFMYSPREAVVSVRTHLENLPAGLALTENQPQSLEVRIKGLGPGVARVIKENHNVCGLDLSKLEVGVNTVTIDQSCFSFPPGISIVDVSPSSVVVKADLEIKKSVSIDVKITGKPAAGYIISDAVADPARVILRGPESLLAPIEVINTKPIEVKGAEDSMSMDVMLDLPDNIEVMLPSDRVRTAIYIEENIIIREMRDIPVRGNNTEYDYSITPPVVRLKVKGPENLASKLLPEKDVEVFLDLNDLIPGVYVRHATIRLPVNIVLVDVEPELFTVKLVQQQNGGIKEDVAGH